MLLKTTENKDIGKAERFLAFPETCQGCVCVETFQRFISLLLVLSNLTGGNVRIYVLLYL